MDWRSTSYFIFDGERSTQELDLVVEQFNGFLRAYEGSGLNAVDVPSGTIVDTYASDGPGWLESLPTDALLTALSAAARDAGFRVIWKPQFVTNEADSGNVSPFFAGNGFDTDRFLGEVHAF